MIFNLTNERVARFETALRSLGTAIANDAPRSVLDKLQADVLRYRTHNLGHNMVEMSPQ